MPSNEELQGIWHQYENGHEHQPSSARQAIEWAVAEGLVELPTVDPYDVLASRMAQALRLEYDTDYQGRRFRVNHAARVTAAGVQYTFWAIMGFATHDHMERSFTQRREQIIGECVQLRTDVDVYNVMSGAETSEFQLVLDFTDDVAERLIASSSGN